MEVATTSAVLAIQLYRADNFKPDALPEPAK